MFAKLYHEYLSQSLVHCEDAPCSSKGNSDFLDVISVEMHAAFSQTVALLVLVTIDRQKTIMK